MNGNTVKICTTIAVGIGAIFGAYKLGENHGHDKGYTKGYSNGHDDGIFSTMTQARYMCIDALDEAISYVDHRRLEDEIEARKQAEQN